MRNGFYTEVAENLLAGAQRGEPAALEELYRAFSAPVHSLACRLCASVEDGEEVLQDTFLEMVRSIGSFRGEGAFGAWLRRITVSKVLMRRRSADARRLEAVPGGESQLQASLWSSDGGVSWPLRFDLERALARLAETSRIVVWLHDVEGLTHAEIAGLFNRSVSFSKSQLSRAHDDLRRWLGEREGTDHASDNGRAAGAAGR